MKNRSAEIEKSFGAELKRTKKQGNCSLFLYFLYLCHSSNHGRKVTMEENTEKAMEPTKKKSKVEEILEADGKNPPKRVNKTWEAAMRLKGSLIVNDPTFCCKV